MMTDDQNQPEPPPEQIDPIGPGKPVPEPEELPEEREEDDNPAGADGVDPEMSDPTETNR